MDLYEHKYNLYFDKEGYIKRDKICPVLVECGSCNEIVESCPTTFNHRKFSCALARTYLIEKYLEI